jgi:hypothetical protein
MEPIGVECRFDASGRVRVRRVQRGERWYGIAQGRQWQDENGRHVLVMLPGDQIAELLLSAADLTWRLVTRPRRTTV